MLTVLVRHVVPSTEQCSCCEVANSVFRLSLQTQDVVLIFEHSPENLLHPVMCVGGFCASLTPLKLKSKGCLRISVLQRQHLAANPRAVRGGAACKEASGGQALPCCFY